MNTIAAVRLEVTEDVLKLQFYCDGDTNVQDKIISDDAFSSVPAHRIGIKKVITSFHDFYMGDLAFLAMTLGMEGSDGYHCLLCNKGGSKFNCPYHEVEGNRRTLGSITQALITFDERKMSNKSLANIDGVNEKLLFKTISPDKILLPMLHCVIGLINKIMHELNSFVLMDALHCHQTKNKFV